MSVLKGFDENQCRRYLQSILEVTRRLASEPRLDPLLKCIADETCNLLGAERATLFLYDAPRNELYSRLATKSEIEVIRFPSDRGIVGAVARGKACLNIPDAYADHRFNPDVDRATGWRTRNILAVPMMNLEGDLVGVLEAMNKHGGPFADEDVTLLEALAAQAGVALERARLLEEYLAKRRLENEMELARDIQSGLLPQTPPPLAGFELAGWSQPSEYAAGDFYDLFPWGDGRVGLMLGDAVGHGVGPAILATEVRSLIRALALHQTRPYTVLTDVNRLLAADVSEGRFVTLALAAVAADGSVHYASAGQGPLHLLRSSGKVETLDSTGLPLGVLPNVDIACGPPLVLERGDVLLFASDGIFECDTASGGDLGVEAVMATARQHLAEPLPALLAAVDTLTHEANPSGRFRDDRTAVAAKRLA